MSPEGAGTATPDPAAFAAVVRKCLGDGGAWATLRTADVASATGRAVTLRLDGGDGAEAYAFKFVEASGDGDTGFPYRRATLRNEARVLRALPGAVGGGLYVADGATEGGDRVWLLTRWLAGPDASRAARALRRRAAEASDPAEAQAARRGLLTLIASVAEAVAALHEAGYLHGDLQPMHFVHDGAAERPTLIDYGLSRRIGGPDPDAPPYRGALVHFAAPEVAAGMPAGADAIPYDVFSEVYALGAVAFLLYTGRAATDYGDIPADADPFRWRLSRIADPAGAYRCRLSATDAPPCPALEAALEWCLAPDRARRCPSARAAADAFREVAPAD